MLIKDNVDLSFKSLYGKASNFTLFVDDGDLLGRSDWRKLQQRADVF